MPQPLIGLEIDRGASRLQLLKAFLSVDVLHLHLTLAQLSSNACKVPSAALAASRSPLHPGFHDT